MATYANPAQNTNINIPDDGAVFTWGDNVMKRVGTNIIQLGNRYADPAINQIYQSAPNYPEANTLWSQLGMSLNPNPVGVAGISQFQQSTPVPGETITQGVSPTNPNAATFTSSTTGNIPTGAPLTSQPGALIPTAGTYTGASQPPNQTPYTGQAAALTTAVSGTVPPSGTGAPGGGNLPAQTSALTSGSGTSGSAGGMGTMTGALTTAANVVPTAPTPPAPPTPPAVPQATTVAPPAPPTAPSAPPVPTAPPPTGAVPPTPTAPTAPMPTFAQFTGGSATPIPITQSNTADQYLQAYLASIAPTSAETGLQSQEQALQSQAAMLGLGQQQTNNALDMQPIARPFITGQQTTVAKDYALQNQTNQAQQQTVTQQLALEQAKRQSAIDVNKATLDYAMNKDTQANQLALHQADQAFTAQQTQLQNQYQTFMQEQQNAYNAAQNQYQLQYGTYNQQLANQFTASQQQAQNAYNSQQQAIQDQFTASQNQYNNQYATYNTQVAAQIQAQAQQAQNAYNAAQEQYKLQYGQYSQDLQNQYTAQQQALQNQFTAGQNTQSQNAAASLNNADNATTLAAQAQAQAATAALTKNSQTVLSPGQAIYNQSGAQIANNPTTAQQNTTPTTPTGTYQAGQLTTLLQSQGKTADDATLQALWKQYGNGGTYTNDTTHNSVIYSAMGGSGSTPTPPVKLTQTTAQPLMQQSIQQLFTSAPRSDKYLSPAEWLQLRALWVGQGLTAASFNSIYAPYKNPNDKYQ